MTDTLSLTLADLAISPLNVRFSEKDANAVEALSASIVELGLLEQLLIHPAPDGAPWAERAEGDAETYDQRAPAAFGVLAGGRRYRAIRLAVKNGSLPTDFSIRVSLKDLSNAEIILLSLSENLMRRDLRGYEVHKAIADLVNEGMTIDQIAQDLGQEAEWVRQQARLGQLHAPIFDAYCAGEISVDQAKAFAATEERELQIHAWEHFARRASFDRRPEDIRAFYKVGDHQTAKLLRFVGEDAYREAGGHFELDLFAGEADHRGRVENEDLLRALAEAKLKLTRAAIREKTGWRDLAFAAEPPQRAGYNDTSLEIHVIELEDLAAELPKGTPDDAIVVTLEIANSGKPIHRIWWKSRAARSNAELGNQPDSKKGDTIAETYGEAKIREGEALLGPDHAQRANQIARDEHGLTAAGVEVMLSTRRELLRNALHLDAENGGNLARDYLVFGLLRSKLAGTGKTEIGLHRFSSSYRLGEDEPKSDVSAYLLEQECGVNWKSAVEFLIAEDFMVIDDPVQAFDAFLRHSERDKARYASLLVGLVLVRSCNLPGYRLPIHDKLAELAGVDAKQLRRLWTPKPAFCGLFGKMQRLELAQPFVEREAFKGWKDHKDAPLASATAHVLAEQQGWVHPAIKFHFEGFETGAAGARRELEPAE